MRISWTDRVTNEEVLERVGQRRALLGAIRKRQLEFLGHVIRREKIEHLCLRGMIEGRRSRGRQRKKFLDSFLEDIEEDITAGQLIQMARDRIGWGQVTAHVEDMALW